MNNLAPMKNCPGGVQGNLNWMPGYKNHAGPVEKLISDFFRMPKKVGALDSSLQKSHIAKGKQLLSWSYHGNDQLKILPPKACFPVLEK